MESLKICIRCKEAKPRTEFYKCKGNKDGLQAYCKECCSKQNKNYYQEHREEIIRKSKEYRKQHETEYRNYSRKYKKTYLKKYRKEHPEKVKRWHQKSYRKLVNENPNFYHAHYLAQKKTKLKDKCEFCGSTENLERHHPDYDYPSIVITVCRSCHKWIHKS